MLNIHFCELISGQLTLFAEGLFWLDAFIVFILRIRVIVMIFERSIHHVASEIVLQDNVSFTVNIYRYKAIGANATSSVISTTWKCISPCLEIL